MNDLSGIAVFAAVVEAGSFTKAGEQLNLQAISQLADLLAELHRPLEALGWRAIQVYYGRMKQSLSEEVANQAMNEINRNRVQILNGDDASATERFILCGVDPETL